MLYDLGTRLIYYQPKKFNGCENKGERTSSLKFSVGVDSYSMNELFNLLLLYLLYYTRTAHLIINELLFSLVIFIIIERDFTLLNKHG